jgi:two-component system nitrogen regulation response regulator GlnG
MAAGREVLLSDLPPELRTDQSDKDQRISGSWQTILRNWADKELNSGSKDILSSAIPDFEQTMIEAALSHTAGRKKDAAKLLGWGRNTLTRKLQEYSLDK